MAPQTISILNLLPEPDVFIHTSHGTRIPAHAPILASMSPVLENLIDRPRKHRSSERIIQIHGVPCDAVTAFVRFLYSSRCTEEEIDQYGMHLLALSHVYMVQQLKQRQFQLRMQQEKRKDDAKWKLLARKVASAKVMSSLSLPKRKRDEETRVTMDNPGIRSFKLL
ncbi:BTB/POZ and TAZ domain-containing protein 2 [Glycine soja]|uniref:BTB/POZ and TAZ domain-containing protein 2 n=1 Tax=Glycine soja TaxID=3848 RepID=A0A0B2PRS2_GLYSO|nr:BTB/POZ and TAZ domain-containing protein 2 [Glycine soja]